MASASAPVRVQTVSWDRSIRLLLLGFAVAARVAMALIVPPWQGPDEPRHFEYVRLLVDKRAQLWREGRLIRIDDNVPELQTEIIASMARHHFWEYTNRPAPPVVPASFFDIWQGSSNQLKQKYSPYHFFLAAVLVPFESAPLETQLYVVRLASALLSALTVAVAYLAGRELVPGDRFVPIVSAAFVATLPMHVFMGGVVNTDNMVTLLGGLVALIATTILRRGSTTGRWALLVGVLVLAVATKRSALGLLPALVLASVVGLGALGSRTLRRLTLALCGVAVICAAAVALAVRPLDRLGDVLGSYFLNEPDQIARLFDGRLTSPQTWALVPRYVEEFHRSFWGVFGWYSVQMSPLYYQVLTLGTIGCLLGLLLRLAVREPGANPGPREIALFGLYPLIVATLVLVAIAERLSYLDASGVPQGRYLFVAIVPIGVLFALAARAFFPSRWFGTRLPAAVTVAALVVLDLVVLRYPLIHTYVTRRLG
jgi:4-amino-4-deoxy-L-arabinose transferase-like glycosyltransferase